MSKKSLYMFTIISSIIILYFFLQIQNSTNSFAEEIFDKCSFITDCISEELEILSLQESEKTVLVTFDDLLSTYSEVKPFCHQYGHALGHFLYDYIGDVNVSLSQVSPLVCGGSVYHAIIMTHMEFQLSTYSNPSDVDISIICANNLDNSQNRERAVCLHGIGHGLTNINNYDVLTAVNYCKQFGKDWEQTYCSKGVFMENIDNNGRMGISTINDDNLFFPCNEVEEIFAPACFFNHSPHVIDYHQKNVDNISKCDDAPKEFVKFCYSGIGAVYASKLFKDDDTSCRLVNTEYQTYCYLGAVYTIAAENSIQSAFPFCTTIPDEFRSDCYREVGKMIKMVYSDDKTRSQQCSSAENSDFVKICMNVKLDEKRIF